MALDPNKTYCRKDSILYLDELPLIWFIADNFVDIEKLTGQGIDYMNRYMRMWPNRFEILNEIS